MLVYNMLENSFRNQTGPDDIPRAEGVLLYLPVGDAGMLVYFGGMEFPYGNSTPRGVSVPPFTGFAPVKSNMLQVPMSVSSSAPSL